MLKYDETKKVSDISTDLLIIGGGPGGYVAAVEAAKQGLDVSLVEKARLGGTCLNIGCIPTKTIIESTHTVKRLKSMEDFGLSIKTISSSNELEGSNKDVSSLASNNIEINMEKVIERKDGVINRLVSGIEFLMKKNKVNVITGEASFIDKNTVYVRNTDNSKVSNYNIKAKNIIIATGSKISKINIPGIDLPCVLDSTAALASTDLPESITIIGGGVIGMEFAFIYNSFGVDVNLVEFMDRTLTILDKDVSREIQKIGKREKIKIHTSSKVTKIEESEDGKALITYENKKGEHTLVSNKVLVAIGREPNIDGLNIEKSGVLLNEKARGIKVDSKMQTNIPNIYAIGDVTDIIQLAHVASSQGMVAVANILGKDEDMDYLAVPNVIFTSPEIATVGTGEDQAKAENMDVSVSKSSFLGNGKALAMDETRGFVKLVKDNKTGKIIGGSIIGPDASALISTLTTIILNGMTVDDTSKIIFPHPTTSETIGDAAWELILYWT